jgi:hypothetical protein
LCDGNNFVFICKYDKQDETKTEGSQEKQWTKDVSHKRRRERSEASAECEGTRNWRNQILDKTFRYINAETDIAIAGSIHKEQRKKVRINPRLIKQNKIL